MLADVRSRDTRIFSTGCAEENTKLNDCFYEKKDWRACTQQVIVNPDRLYPFWQYETDNVQMEAFKQCWKQQGNNDRTEAKDA